MRPGICNSSSERFSNPIRSEKHRKRKGFHMGIYDEQQQLVDSVCADIASFRTLIAPKDESKKSEFGFVPGMNNMQNAVNALDGCLRNLREGVFPVLFIGGFSSGKSTLLNALMRKELLSSSINAETAVVTKIVFNAEEEKVTVYKKQKDENGQPVTEYYSIAGFFEAYRVDREYLGEFGEIAYVRIQQTQDGIGGSLVQLVYSPGTSNSEFVTLTAKEFAAKANAVVYLINADMSFTDEDKQYIKEHYAGRGLKNLFFVINRYDCVHTDEQEVLKENVRNQLHDVFTVDGVFDRALFDSRVFYTNAYGSLNTRLGRKTKTSYGDFLLDDDDTGVPDFERALSAFLMADDRVKSALAAYVPKLSAIYTLAKAKTAEEIEQIEQYKARKAARKAELERRHDKLNAAAYRVEQILSGIQYSCQINAAELVRDILRDYDEYVTLIAREWDGHFSDLLVLVKIKFSFMDALRIATTKDQAKKKELAEPLRFAVMEFLKSKQEVLSANIEQSVQAVAEKAENDWEYYLQQLEALDCPVDGYEILHNIRMNKFVISYPYPCIPDPGIFQTILNLLDPDLDTIVLNRNNGAKNCLCRMKDDVITALRYAKVPLADYIERKACSAVLRDGEEFSDAYRTELAGYQESLAQMIADLDNENFNLPDEEERAKRRLEKMVDIISHVSLLTTGKCLSESDVLARAAV